MGRKGARDVGREGELERERTEERQKDMVGSYTHFTDGTEWGRQ